MGENNSHRSEPNETVIDTVSRRELLKKTTAVGAVGATGLVGASGIAAASAIKMIVSEVEGDQNRVDYTITTTKSLAGQSQTESNDYVTRTRDGTRISGSLSGGQDVYHLRKGAEIKYIQTDGKGTLEVDLDGNLEDDSGSAEFGAFSIGSYRGKGYYDVYVAGSFLNGCCIGDQQGLELYDHCPSSFETPDCCGHVNGAIVEGGDEDRFEITCQLTTVQLNLRDDGASIYMDMDRP